MAWTGPWRRAAKAWGLDGVKLPWDQGRPAIYDFLRAHAAADGSLDGEGLELPDAPANAPGQLRWAAGAEDGVRKRHVKSGDARKEVRSVASALDAVLKDAHAVRLAALYALAVNEETLSFIDPVLEGLAERAEALAERVRAVGRFLATKAPDRGAVKLGIGLLGLAGAEEDLPVLELLGAHDEFTLYAAVALQRQVSPPDRGLFSLARRVHGWGRVELVERLAETEDTEIKAWLLRDGYRNAVMYEYTALVCAVTGGLLDELERPAPDDALLRGAGEILQALVDNDGGGPAAGMSHYADGARASRLYLEHLAGDRGEPGDVVVAATLRDYAGEERGGWSADDRFAVRAAASMVLTRSDWPARVLSEVDSDDRLHENAAIRAAQVLGLDVWEKLFEKTRRTEAETLWYWISKTDDPARIARLSAHAEKNLGLAAIASGPADEMGFGEPFTPHRKLDSAVGALARAPGVGLALLRAALSSPVVRNRYGALRTLAAWTPARWPAEAADLLRAALEREPHDGVRQGIRGVLDGRTFEEAVRTPRK